jgi:hypothetical protein
MNATAWAGQLAAPLALVAGLLTCFWGYRILKITLGITGFIVGMAAGSSFGLSVAPGNDAVALICGLVAGVIGAALCVWLFFLGVFLLGASTGAIVGAAICSAAAIQPQPIILIVVSIVFGLVALALQKFMIILSTGFGGSYLITAGILHFITGVQDVSPPWFSHLQTGSAGLLGYIALAFWIILGVSGVSFQYRGTKTADKPAHRETQVA